MLQKIIFLEVNALERQTISAGLNDSYNVFFAKNTSEALELLTESIAAAVVDSDVLASEDFKLLRIRSKNEFLREIPVIVLTDAKNDESSALALRLGADDFFERPVDIRKLKNCLKYNIEKYENDDYESCLIEQSISMSQLCAVLNNISSAVSVSALENGVPYVLFSNERFYKLFGYSSQDYIKKAIILSENIHPDDKQRIIECIGAATSSLKPAVISYRVIIDGKTRYIRTRLTFATIKGISSIVHITVSDDVTVEQEQDTLQKAEALQLQNEAFKMKSIMESVNGGLLAVKFSSDGEVLFSYTNEKFFEIYGYSKEELAEMKLHVLSLILPEDLDGIIRRIRENPLGNREPVVFEYQCKKRDGNIAYIRCNTSVTSIEGIGDDIIVSIINDITNEYLAKEKEKVVSQWLRIIAENMNGGVTATVSRGGKAKFLFSNRRFYEMLGYTEEEFAQVHPEIFSCIFTDDRARVERDFKQSLLRLKPYKTEYRVVKRDGSIRWVESKIAITKISGVNEQVQIAVTNDITNLRLAEMRARDASEQLKIIADNVNCGVTVSTLCKGKKELLYANRFFYKLLGYTQEEMALKDCLSFIHPDDRAHMLKYYKNDVGNKAFTECRALHKDGSTVRLRVNFTRSQYRSISEPVEMGIFIDIDGSKKPCK